MPKDLLKAHKDLDRAVWEAYGKSWNIDSEADCIKYLMKLYVVIEGSNYNVYPELI